MRGRSLLAFVVAALVLSAGAAVAAPPPGLPVGSPIGSPIKLPVPSPGTAVFARIDLTGTLRPGKKPGAFTLVGVGSAPGAIRAVSFWSKPVVSGNTVKIRAYIAVADVSKRVLFAGVDPEAQIIADTQSIEDFVVKLVTLGRRKDRHDKDCEEIRKAKAQGARGARDLRPARRPVGGDVDRGVPPGEVPVAA